MGPVNTTGASGASRSRKGAFPMPTMDKVKAYLKQIDEVIAQGPYTDSWESLCLHTLPKWYHDAKFGIFIH